MSLSAMKPVFMLAIAAAVVGAAFLYLKREQAHEDGRIAAAKAVSTLPFGVEQSWQVYVGRRLNRLFVREGKVIRVTDDAAEFLKGRSTTYVSANTAYQIDCDPVVGGTVTFGYGEGAPLVYVFGAVPATLPNSEKPPLLPVSQESIAAANLTKNLCEQIRRRIEAITSGGNEAHAQQRPLHRYPGETPDHYLARTAR